MALQRRGEADKAATRELVAEKVADLVAKPIAKAGRRANGDAQARLLAAVFSVPPNESD